MLLTACFISQTGLEPAHAQNPVFTEVIERGLTADGKTINLPPPRLVDGQDLEFERGALRDIAGSEQAAQDLLRDSVTAPFIIRVHDMKSPDATVRAANLWFVIFGELDKIDPLKEAGRANEKAVEVANMWFQNKFLTNDEIAAAGIKPCRPGLARASGTFTFTPNCSTASTLK